MAERIYLIRRGDLYKIGFSINPKRRARELSLSGNPCEVVHSFPCRDFWQVESKLHAYFTGKRVMGEWFRLDEGDVDLVRSIASCDTFYDLPWRIHHAEAPAQRAWGSSDQRFIFLINSEVVEALGTYRARHEFPPTVSEVCRRALREFLVREGLLR